MRIASYLCVSAVCFFLCGTVSFTVSAQSKSIVSFELSSADSIAPGDTLRCKITLNIEPSWYIYAPVRSNRLQQMQVMQLRFDQLPGGFRQAGQLELPASEYKDGKEVFMGQGVVFYLNMIADKNLLPGLYNLKIILTYQACNEKICYSPVNERKQIAVRVRAPLK